MAMFVINQPGEHKLYLDGAQCLHSRNDRGFVHGADERHGVGAAVAAHAQPKRDEEGFDYHRKNGGPGAEVSCYLQKDEAPKEKVGALLAASSETTRLLHSGHDASNVFKCRQLLLSFDEFYFQGPNGEIDNHGGSHFPQCVMTKTQGK